MDKIILVLAAVILINCIVIERAWHQINLLDARLTNVEMAK